MSHPAEDDDCRNDQMAFITQVMAELERQETCPYCRSLDVFKQSGDVSGIETTWNQCGRCNYTWGQE
jgi:hypothetical protein